MFHSDVIVNFWVRVCEVPTRMCQQAECARRVVRRRRYTCLLLELSPSHHCNRRLTHPFRRHTWTETISDKGEHIEAALKEGELHQSAKESCTNRPCKQSLKPRQLQSPQQLLRKSVPHRLAACVQRSQGFVIVASSVLFSSWILIFLSGRSTISLQWHSELQ